RIAEEDTRKTTGTARDQRHDEHSRQGHPRRDATTAPWGLCLRSAVDLSVGGGPRGHRGRGTVSARGRWWVPRWGLGRAGGAGRVGGRDGVHGGSAAWGCGTGVGRSVPRVLGAGGDTRSLGSVRSGRGKGGAGVVLRVRRRGRSGGGCAGT